MLSRVPHWGDFVQAGTDNLQIGPRLGSLVPTTLKDAPYFVNEPKVCRRLRLVRSNPFQYRIADLLSIPTVIGYMSAKHLFLHELFTAKVFNKHTPRR